MSYETAPQAPVSQIPTTVAACHSAAEIINRRLSLILERLRGERPEPAPLADSFTRGGQLPLMIASDRVQQELGRTSDLLDELSSLV